MGFRDRIREMERELKQATHSRESGGLLDVAGLGKQLLGFLLAGFATTLGLWFSIVALVRSSFLPRRTDWRSVQEDASRQVATVRGQELGVGANTRDRRTRPRAVGTTPFTTTSNYSEGGGSGAKPVFEGVTTLLELRQRDKKDCDGNRAPPPPLERFRSEPDVADDFDVRN
jgi:hypothetical protein